MPCDDAGGDYSRGAIVKREIVRASGFARHLRHWLKKYPDEADVLQEIFSALSDDAFQAVLGTHKLKGKWASYYACSAGYDARIIFELFQQDGVEAIQLVTIGTTTTFTEPSEHHLDRPIVRRCPRVGGGGFDSLESVRRRDGRRPQTCLDPRSSRVVPVARPFPHRGRSGVRRRFRRRPRRGRGRAHPARQRGLIP